jgi:hypothetical protein
VSPRQNEPDQATKGPKRDRQYIDEPGGENDCRSGRQIRMTGARQPGIAGNARADHRNGHHAGHVAFRVPELTPSRAGARTRAREIIEEFSLKMPLTRITRKVSNGPSPHRAREIIEEQAAAMGLIGHAHSGFNSDGFRLSRFAQSRRRSSTEMLGGL